MPPTPATAQFEHSVLQWNSLKTTSIAGVRVLFGVYSHLLCGHTQVYNIISVWRMISSLSTLDQGSIRIECGSTECAFNHRY